MQSRMKQSFLLMLFIVGIRYLRDSARAATPVERFACYGSNECTFVNLACNNSDKAFILKADYGHQQKSTQCPDEIANNCSNLMCCKPIGEPCYQRYTTEDFENIYNTSWNMNSSRIRAEWKLGKCSSNFTRYSGFIRIEYVCLHDDESVDIKMQTSLHAETVVVHYTRTSEEEEGYWQCRVSTPATAASVHVMLVKEKSVGSDENNCSTLGLDADSFLPCNFTHVVYNILTKTNDFNVTLSLRDPSSYFEQGWALLHAPNGTKLTVVCGYYCTDLDNCTGDPQTPPTTSTTPAPQSSSTAASTAASSPASSAATTVGPGHPAPAGNAGAVAGGVVAAIVVLAAVLLGIFCFVKRRRQKSSDAEPQKNGTSAGPPLKPVHSSQPSSSPCSHTAPAGKYEDITCDAPTPEPSYFVVEPESSMKLEATKKSEQDYDLLGQKKPQSSSSNTAATYGRLGEVGGGGEDTDYSYDHLARGRQAAPDVIDSDYNTPDVTSEGDYNVAGIPKKQHVITGSDYDTAEIVMSEGDYNRVDFQSKKQQVITGSDYDTADIVMSEGDYNSVDFQEEK